MDLQAAMKARNTEKVMILRDVITAIKNLKVEKMVASLPEADVIGIIRKEVSKRVEAVGFARQANRQDLIDKNEGEKALLEAYLPQQMSAEQLETVIRTLATEIGSTQIGLLMAKLRERHAGLFYGKLASDLIRKLA
ncbi:MAG: GatB/YqeY domain-containing protein [Deltaproteobacteria bacterium]|nr:GatB/YqeY domain-containing protein [Deltaproteobacteria bacterium]